MPDYPDWTRLFYLTGTAITIPINIESSDITLDVNLVGSDIQMDVNIAAAAVTLDFNFADQSVAVFDAAKWFAHQAAQWSVRAQGSANSGSSLVASRTVPAGKVAFILGCGWSPFEAGFAGAFMPAGVVIDGSTVGDFGSYRGGAAIVDVPFRATAGQEVQVFVLNFDSVARTLRVAMWGYDEDA
jgi:hypothetical protein